MELVAILLIVWAAGPLLGLTVVYADSRAGGRPLNTRRLLVAAAVGGALCSTPLAFVIWIGSHGLTSAFPVGWLIGALVGLVAGGAAVGLRGAYRRHRDRTG